MSTVTNIPNNAVCDPNGKAIEFTGETAMGAAMEAARLVGEFLDYDLLIAPLANGSRVLTPDDHHPQNPLTVPERAIVQAIAWYTSHYAAGMKRDEKAMFPKAVTPYGDSDSHAFRNEERAYQFAEIAERVFDVAAEIIEGPNGWLVAISQEDGLTAEEFAQLTGVCRVLNGYSILRAPSTPYGDVAPSPESRANWKSRQNAPLAEIKATMDEILSRLTPHAEESTAPAPVAEDADPDAERAAPHRNADKHIAPGSDTRKRKNA